MNKNGTYRHWTEQEINFIRANYNKMTRQELADHFNVPLSNMKSVTRRYGIYKSDFYSSSYIENHYGNVFETISYLIQPKVTLEIGVLDGYSAMRLKKHSQRTILADLFEEFPYKHAVRSNIEERFSDCEIIKMDYYKDYDKIRYQSIDLLHIDVANDGRTYRMFADHYLWKLRPGGVAILEGGSAERDEYWWMNKFGKPKIRPVLEQFKKEKINYTVIEAFPSITIVRR